MTTDGQTFRYRMRASLRYAATTGTNKAQNASVGEPT